MSQYPYNMYAGITDERYEARSTGPALLPRRERETDSETDRGATLTFLGKGRGLGDIRLDDGGRKIVDDVSRIVGIKGQDLCI